MKVPYARKWQKEADKLRKIALDCDLTEELKWGKPCFTFQRKNVAIVMPPQGVVRARKREAVKEQGCAG